MEELTVTTSPSPEMEALLLLRGAFFIWRGFTPHGIEPAPIQSGLVKRLIIVFQFQASSCSSVPSWTPSSSSPSPSVRLRHAGAEQYKSKLIISWPCPAMARGWIALAPGVAANVTMISPRRPYGFGSIVLVTAKATLEDASDRRVDGWALIWAVTIVILLVAASIAGAWLLELYCDGHGGGSETPPSRGETGAGQRHQRQGLEKREIELFPLLVMDHHRFTMCRSSWVTTMNTGIIAAVQSAWRSWTEGS
ncbi:hypothetical protein ACP70R_046763 [Stipagrostis hirtigluma subsp. patula]